jgi:hypothetical protein
MGAANFSSILVGKDLGQAFNEAVKSAQWEYGHGGYTGTIAEKDGYVNLGPLPARVTVDKLERMIFDLSTYEWQYADWREGRRKGREPKNPVPTQHRAFVEKAAKVYDDKWGPALVVEITGSQAAEIKRRFGRAGTRDKVWVAMGMASD